MSDQRVAPIAMGREEFKQAGHTVADFIDAIDERLVTTGATPSQIHRVLGRAALPEHGAPPRRCCNRPRRCC